MLPNIPGLKHTSSNNFFIMAGPCAIEGEEIAFEIADKINTISNKLEIPWIFKGSYRKANRSKLDSFTGIGDELALEILQKVGKHYEVPTVTDIHETHEAALAAKYVDVLQIPAFLFRQTELLVAAANTGKFVNIKKGQFAAASAMSHAAQKVIDSGSNKIMLTDRGNMFGYSDMVVDFRNITWMKAMGYPVIMDITHSLQQPNQSSGVTGGLPEMIETIAKAAIAVGVDGLFIETHPRPNEAKSDGANMLQIDLLEPLMEKLLKIRKAIL
jgi:2-dehydro-3-deoxyphosphooctonate aldolase (KDO 8-P synthase)